MRRSVGSRIRDGECCFGLSVVLPCPQVIELAALAGYDFVRIDWEHAMFGEEKLRELLTTARLLKMPCQVRIPDLHGVTRILGQEPSGLMLPHVESGEEAAAIVDACRFAPLGRRGMDGNTRDMRCGGMSRAEYMEVSEENLDLIVQLESREAIERIDEILAVEGIDMAATGRADLSQELGVPGEKDHPDVVCAENMIIRKTLEHGKIPAIAADSPKRVQELYEMGVRCFLTGKDEALLAKGMKEKIRKMRDFVPLS